MYGTRHRRKILIIRFVFKLIQAKRHCAGITGIEPPRRNRRCRQICTALVTLFCNKMAQFTLLSHLVKELAWFEI